MDAETFSTEFSRLYQELYRLAARRIENSRQRLSVETTALLLHLAQAGPSTLSELARHLERALSTLSVKLAELQARGLLAQQRDALDNRRVLIWLTPAGRIALTDALDVLDRPRIVAAARQLDAAARLQLVDSLRSLTDAIDTTTTGDP